MLPARWFDYPDLELGGVLMTALNEMLLQSHDGIIRIFPAMPAEWRDAAFQLRAVGAFMVTGEMRNGEVQPYLIESLNGSECHTEVPWPLGVVKDIGTGRLVAQQGDRLAVLSFSTTKGSRYLVFRSGGPETLPQTPLPRHPNNTPKQWRGRRIGIPRQF
jgi:hypothetical protein